MADLTDQQLIEGYLVNMAHGSPPLSTDVVFKLDVYGDSEWMKRFEGREEDTLCFFTRLMQRSQIDSRIRRAAANGTWKNQHPPRDIYDDDGKIIGSKSNFSFIPRKGVPEPSSKWVMHEYRLKGRYIDNLYALCRIRKKKSINGSSAADANGNGRAADDDEDMSQWMMELENTSMGGPEPEPYNEDMNRIFMSLEGEVGPIGAISPPIDEISFMDIMWDSVNNHFIAINRK